MSYGVRSTPYTMYVRTYGVQSTLVYRVDNRAWSVPYAYTIERAQQGRIWIGLRRPACTPYGPGSPYSVLVYVLRLYGRRYLFHCSYGKTRSIVRHMLNLSMQDEYRCGTFPSCGISVSSLLIRGDLIC